MSYLKYVGGGFLPGVPARDLTQSEAEMFGKTDYLVQSGLYRLVQDKMAARRKKADQQPELEVEDTEREVDSDGGDVTDKEM